VQRNLKLTTYGEHDAKVSLYRTQISQGIQLV